MIDPAVGFMAICYYWMCVEWGYYKAIEYLCLDDGISLIRANLTFLFHTALAPITATVDLFRRVK